MSKKLKLDDVIKLEKRKKVLVSDIVGLKGKIFELIKEGFEFDDEVLDKAHIKKTCRDEMAYCQITDHKEKKKKEYAKDSESLKSILKSLSTLDNQTEETFNTENKSLMVD